MHPRIIFMFSELVVRGNNIVGIHGEIHERHGTDVLNIIVEDSCAE